jgi:putative heme iron utilization protein
LTAPILNNLESVLKTSLEKASPHTRKVYGQNPLSADEIVQMANDKTMMTLVSTVKTNGRPHLSPSDVVSVDGKIFVGADEATAHYSNLKRNPAIAVVILDGRKRQALLEGTVEFLDMNSGLALKVQEAEKQKNGWATEAVAELRPEKAFSWRRPD